MSTPQDHNTESLSDVAAESPEQTVREEIELVGDDTDVKADVGGTVPPDDAQ